MSITPAHARTLIHALAYYLGPLCLDLHVTRQEQVYAQAEYLWLYLPPWVKEHTLLTELQTAVWEWLLDHWNGTPPS